MPRPTAPTVSLHPPLFVSKKHPTLDPDPFHFSRFTPRLPPIPCRRRRPPPPRPPRPHRRSPASPSPSPLHPSPAPSLPVPDQPVGEPAARTHAKRRRSPVSPQSPCHCFLPFLCGRRRKPCRGAQAMEHHRQGEENPRPTRGFVRQPPEEEASHGRTFLSLNVAPSHPSSCSCRFSNIRLHATLHSAKRRHKFSQREEKETAQCNKGNG
ncbi:serine/arginine repetitive matrix protein 1-like isoform X3 [Triticum urartu]|uniref:serine/arginine repetitive matrix protein 1-like isoform X3 n=1 Tax=Triticum urartu TaxID=4572 RepID=UPI002044417F|nr:serine/arginine repetitive matrix protein 1-like isoform X3 [Triticum urartu]